MDYSILGSILGSFYSREIAIWCYFEGEAQQVINRL